MFMKNLKKQSIYVEMADIQSAINGVDRVSLFMVAFFSEHGRMPTKQELEQRVERLKEELIEVENE